MNNEQLDPQNIFEAPQISGNIPAKIKTFAVDQVPTAPDPDLKSPKKKNKFLIPGIIIASFLILLVTILVILLVTQKKPEEKIPEASPAPQTTQSPIEITFDTEISAQYKKLDQELNNLEIQDVELIYPQVTWKVEF